MLLSNLQSRLINLKKKNYNHIGLAGLSNLFGGWTFIYYLTRRSMHTAVIPLCL